MIFHPKHDYLLIIAVFILVLAALGAIALHLGGVGPTGEVIYHPCQGLYLDYLENNCDYVPNQLVCIRILEEKDIRRC
jgi:hypothetical protein